MTLRVSAVSASAAWPQITGIKSRLSTNYQHASSRLPTTAHCNQPTNCTTSLQLCIPFPISPPTQELRIINLWATRSVTAMKALSKQFQGRVKRYVMLEKNFVSLAVVVPKRQLKSRHLFQANDSCKPVISFYSISAAHICSQRLIYKPGWPRTSQLGASCSTLATAAIRVVSVSGLKTNPSHSSCLKCLYDESVQLVLLSIGGRRCN